MSAITDAWRTRRSPALAALADLEGDAELTARLDAVIGARVAVTLENLRAFANEDSPVFASWVLRQLESPPFTGPSAEPLLAHLIDVAARLRDPRLAIRAPRIKENWTVRVTPKPARVRLLARLDKAAHAIEPARAATADEAKLEAAWAEQLGGQATTKRTAADLLADIYANPRDDGPRLVYADFLLEQGDPRGEFITLQLSGREPERQAALLKKYGKEWLGPLASVISWGKGYSRTRFERGFLAFADFIQVAERKLSVIVDDPSWALVEDFMGAPRTLLVSRAPLRGLRRLQSGPEEIATFAAAKRVFPSLARLEVQAETVDFGLLAAVFPALEAVTFMFPLGPTIDEVAERVRAASAIGVKRLEFHRWVDGPDRKPAVPFDALVDGVSKLESRVPTVALKPQYSSYPGPPLIELVAKNGRYAKIAP